jgi:DNA-directed RNA polymerase specialized sigma24 family protein
MSSNSSNGFHANNQAPDPFPITSWSMVRRVGGSHVAEVDRALNELCKTYWYPIYAYVRRTVGKPEDAEDLTQGYLARLTQRDYINQANPEKGKFRAFLLADLKLFLSKEWVRGRAVKRGGCCVIESFDHAMAEGRYGVEPVDHDSPEKLFDRAWATTLLERVRERLRQHFVSKGQQMLYEALQPFIAWNGGDESYADTAAKLGKSVNDIKVSVFRMRKRYRALLEEEIAETVATWEDIKEEIGLLATLFA